MTSYGLNEWFWTILKRLQLDLIHFYYVYQVRESVMYSLIMAIMPSFSINKTFIISIHKLDDSAFFRAQRYHRTLPLWIATKFAY